MNTLGWELRIVVGITRIPYEYMYNFSKLKKFIVFQHFSNHWRLLSLQSSPTTNKHGEILLKLYWKLLKITGILNLLKYWKRRFYWNLSGLLKETEILILLTTYWKKNLNLDNDRCHQLINVYGKVSRFENFSWMLKISVISLLLNLQWFQNFSNVTVDRVRSGNSKNFSENFGNFPEDSRHLTPPT